MSGQEEDHGSDASAKHTRSGILTPASENSLNPTNVASSGNKKRKRDGNTMEDLLKDPFVVKPYPPSTVPVKLRTLQPLMLLPRSQLSLSSLDIISTSKTLGQSRLFETHVKILELEDRMGSQPMVLIARLDDGRTLCAVERESRGLYALCQLGSWINLQGLKDAAVASKQELHKVPEKGLSAGAMTQGAVPIAVSESGKYSKKKRLAIEAIQSMVKRPSTVLGSESQEPQIKEEAAPNLQLFDKVTVPPQQEASAQLTAAEIFENLRTQYFEALYISKASLAYFAKGPLSRARAAFHLDYDSTLDLNDHIAFLESLVMSSTLGDKKYREGVPNCVALFDIQDHSGEDANQTSANAKKRKSTKKMKPGKTGLYPNEDALIRRWWANHDDDAESGAPESSRDGLTKRRISQLRIRETQLQIIVILEVLALQPLVSEREDVAVGLPAALPASEAAEAKDKKAKSKKPDHLTMLIDVHIDRLCIWQSIAHEAIKSSGSDLENTSGQPDGTISINKHADNILKDFCIEVIAPFFSSRLPERCAIINKKLGGPVVVSPPRPKLSKSASSLNAPSRPGAATKRPVPVKPRRSLQRVLTDDRERRGMSRGPNKAIALMRSATMPTVPGLKREVSEAPSLSSIPSAESQSLGANRGGVLKSKRFFQREVDLSSLAPDGSGNTKAKKQATIEAELKEAIAALKKPNRELAGKSLAETAEKRSISASHNRKSKKPVRNPLFQGVQISATPKANRQKDMGSEPQPSSLAKSIERPESAVVPVSSLPRIPQSISRPSNEGIRKMNPLFSAIQATPTRKPVPGYSQRGGLLSAPENDYHANLASSPLHVRRSSAQLFTAVPDSAVKKISPFSSFGLEETPVKRKQEVRIDRSHPGDGGDKENDGTGAMIANSSQGSGTNEPNIYKSLGWENVDDVDELA